jgi:sugar phosphate permease
MVGSGTCAALIGLVFDRPALLVAVALVWGVMVIADSAQFSAAISELAPPAYVGTALSLQTGLGFLLTLVSIRLVPAVADAWDWTWAFVILAPGPLLGSLAMWALRRSPESLALAGGRR